MERYKLLEQLEAIAEKQPVFPGDTISHKMTKYLEEGDLIKRNLKGNLILSEKGQTIINIWLEAIPYKVLPL